MMKLIEVENVSKSFDGLNVLDSVSLSVSSGENLSIVGPSGVGKSTLLRLIAGLDDVDSGLINLFTNKISMVFQYSALLNSYTVSENIKLALHAHKISKEEKHQKVIEKLKLVGLEKYQDYFPDQLSGGQRKRVAFARAIVNDPEIILYDEPTAGLDPILSTLIEDYINKLSSEYKVASVVVTHQLSTIRRTSKRVLMLCFGKIVWEGPPDKFLSTDNPYVKQFVNAELEGPILAGLLE
ncbi:MAG: hypothetical protein A3B68_03685 [Candidatus Melainabacteria bacterium RIFCSPHIGHO2_02_FULL_34_12]|nr:MAG: hypothetical protein A3B68_03685 [Candidatus Melainabacteria bacterium RIFCSPHIGHO2_02_FULL_34_12]